jgi:hypothetical protein
MSSQSAAGGRPRVLAIAGGLWLALGVLWMVFGLASFTVLIYGPVDDPIMYFIPPLVVLIGVAFVVLARLLGQGRDTRIPLTVLGIALVVLCVFFLGFFAVFVGLLLLVWVGAATVLQFLPDSGSWLKSSRQARPVGA